MSSEFDDLIDSNGAKIQRPLSYFVRIILIVAIGYALYAHLWRVLFIDLLLLVLVLIPSIFRKYNIDFPKEFDFILFVFVILSFFLGDIRGVIIQIFFGAAVSFVSVAFLIIITKNSKIKLHWLVTYIAVIGFSMGVSAFSELVKFLLKNYLAYNVSLADYNYAMASLVFVFVGSFLATSLALAYLSNHEIPLLGHLINRFKKKNPNLFIERLDSPNEIIGMIRKGENEHLEFKSTLRINLHTGEPDKKIEHSVLKTISAFLNTEGGSLLIGVSDSGLISGIERDHFQSIDKFNLHFTNLVKEYVGNENLPYMHFELVQIEDKHVMKVDCRKAKKPVFLKFNKEEEFYMRVGAATVQVSGSKLVSYIGNNFG